MPKFSDPKLRELFAPRPPVEFFAPTTNRKMPAYTGLGAFLNRFEVPSSSETHNEQPIEILKPEEIRSKKRKRRMEEHEEEVLQKTKLWCPNDNPHATDEAYNTLFISRLNYKTTAETLKREFEVLAPVKNVRLVHDLEGKSRGYAFVEMEDDSATRLAYSKMRGRTIDGADIFIDVERGRTVKDWKPRRLGNTTNTPRIDKPKKAVLKAQQMAAAAQQMDRRDPRRGGPGGPGGPREERRGGGGHFQGGRGGRGGYDRDRNDRPPMHDQDHRGGGNNGGRYERRGDDYRGGGGDRYERRDDRDSYDSRRR